MIDEALAERDAQTFSEVTLKKWPHPRTEIQDDYEFVLLSVDVPLHLAVNKIEFEERKAVVLALNALMPVPPSEPLGTWIVVFLQDGEVYESILPNDL